ncbi:hypothetical protein ABZ372_34420, partial [Streptomyces sp. NPDC005921]
MWWWLAECGPYDRPPHPRHGRDSQDQGTRRGSCTHGAGAALVYLVYHDAINAFDAASKPPKV